VHITISILHFAGAKVYDFTYKSKGKSVFLLYIKGKDSKT